MSMYSFLTCEIRSARLRQAYQRYLEGELESARRLCWEGMREALEQKDPLAQGQAFLLVAKVEVFDSFPSRALSLVRCALELFDDSASCRTEALTMISYCLTTLGEGEAAVHAAQKGVELAQELGQTAPLVTSLNYLGVANLWGQQFEEARSNLEAATAFAREFGLKDAELQPVMNICFLEAVVAHERSFEFTRQGLRVPHSLSDALLRSMQTCRALTAQGLGRSSSTNMPLERTRATAMCVCLGLAHLYGGDEASALQQASRCESVLQDVPPQSWLHAVPWWLRSEQARLALRPREAGRFAERMLEHSRRGGHIPLERLAQRIMEMSRISPEGASAANAP